MKTEFEFDKMKNVVSVLVRDLSFLSARIIAGCYSTNQKHLAAKNISIGHI